MTDDPIIDQARRIQADRARWDAAREAAAATGQRRTVPFLGGPQDGATFEVRGEPCVRIVVASVQGRGGTVGQYVYEPFGAAAVWQATL